MHFLNTSSASPVPPCNAIGTAVFGAEDIAVSTLVAEVSEVGDLSCLGDSDGLRLTRLEAGSHRMNLEALNLASLQLEAEVRSVRAGRDAEIAVGAVEEIQFATDLLGSALVLRQSVARVFQDPVGVGLGVE